MKRNNILRKPTEREIVLLDYLIKKGSVCVPNDWKSMLLVSPMDDGGMGGLTLYPHGVLETKRKFGEKVSECFFYDKDGMLVSPALFVDDSGALFELDIFKGDFSKLIEIPSTSNFFDSYK